MVHVVKLRESNLSFMRTRAGLHRRDGSIDGIMNHAGSSKANGVLLPRTCHSTTTKSIRRGCFIYFNYHTLLSTTARWMFGRGTSEGVGEHGCRRSLGCCGGNCLCLCLRLRLGLCPYQCPAPCRESGTLRHLHPAIMARESITIQPYGHANG